MRIVFLFFLFDSSDKENENQKNALLYDALFDFDVYIDIKIGIPVFYKYFWLNFEMKSLSYNVL